MVRDDEGAPWRTPARALSVATGSRWVAFPNDIRARGVDFRDPSDNSTDIGPGEIIPLEEEWLAGCPGKCVGEDVAEIEPCGVVPSAEAAVGPSRLGHMLGVDGDHH